MTNFLGISLINPGVPNSFNAGVANPAPGLTSCKLPWSNTPACYFHMILNTLFSCVRCLTRVGVELCRCLPFRSMVSDHKKAFRSSGTTNIWDILTTLASPLWELSGHFMVKFVYIEQFTKGLFTLRYLHLVTYCVFTDWIYIWSWKKTN